MSGTISLYATYGEHTKRHKLILYFRHDKDWTRNQRVAIGSTGKPLCVCQMTELSDEICAINRKHGKASCLAYGHGIVNDKEAFRRDLEYLKLSASDIKLFCEKAFPYLS